jgi:hypothetical protein
MPVALHIRHESDAIRAIAIVEAGDVGGSVAAGEMGA